MMDSQSNELQHDFRMKRHPELQPFVPYDKDRYLTNSKSPLNFGASVSSRTNNNNSNSNTLRSITSSDAKNPPKKCVSMNRLNQLAQPKRVPNNNNNNSNDYNSNGKRKKETINVLNGKQQSPAHQKPRQVQQQHHRQQSQSQQQRQELEHSLNGGQQKQVEKQLQEPVQQEGLDFSKLEQQQQLPDVLKQDSQEQQSTEPKQQEQSHNNHDQNLSNEASLFLSFTKEDEDKRIAYDEELKQAALREEEERQSRQILVDNILSKFNNSSNVL